ncbi:signal peptidase II [Candidatus Gracilibacteria bacterium]|jgi:signal peptidase II|nr:signal peptidase II [Candidatus Gracilibacteria bacterium]
MTTRLNKLCFYAFVCGLLLLDQASKAFFVANGDIEISRFFDFTLSYNEGSAFSLAIPSSISGSLGLLVAILLLLMPFSKKFDNYFSNQRLLAMMALLTAGVLGNTIDRLRIGKVIDFFHFSFWPIFNLADSFLVVALIGLLISEFLLKSKK